MENLGMILKGLHGKILSFYLFNLYINLDTGIEVKYIPISKWYHYIEFFSDGTKIIADGDTLEIS